MKYSPHLFVIIATALVAGSFISATELAQVINPISLTLLRFVGGSVLLTPLILLSPKWRKSIPSIMPRALAISLFYALFFIALFESLKYTLPINTSTLFTLVPFVTALLSLIIFKAKLSHHQVTAYALALIGTCWVVFKGDIHSLLGFSLNKGDIIFLGGALSMCFYSISMKLLYRGDDMVPLVFCTLLGGIIWMSLALVLSEQPLQWNLINRHLVAHMAYLIIGATLLTMYLFQRATIDLGPNKVMAYSYLTPAILAGFLFIFKGEAISYSVLPGILITTLATIVLQKLPVKSISKN